MAKPDSWMPYYGDDFQSDTAHCSAAERGAYVDLLWACWKGGNLLPLAPDKLMRLARCTLAEWKVVRETVMAFFIETPMGWTQKRVGKELAAAVEAYEKKIKNVEATNAKRIAKRDAERNAERPTERNAEADAKRDATHNSHSSSDEKHSSNVLAKPPKRKSQIPPDWKPNEKDVAHATDRGLSAQTIENITGPFRDHHLAKQTLSADFSANWRTWVANHINFHGTGPWPRADAGRPAGNVSRSASAVAARDSILAKAGIRRGDDHEIRTESTDRIVGDETWTNFIGPVIDADFRERSAGPVDGIESADTPEPGDNGGSGEPVRSVPETLGGVPERRGETRSDDAAKLLPMVAGMAGIEGQIGASHISPPDDVGSDDYAALPAFLDVRHKIDA